MNETVSNYLHYAFRLTIFIITNLYALPCYIIWMTLLTPVRYLAPNIYWKMESFMFRMLETMVVTWIGCNGYKILECGDRLDLLHDKEAIILCNHQSTADTPILMLASHNKGMAAGTTMWIMYILFKWTNFGLISQHREDFFIDQGKDVRDVQLIKLKDHLSQSYLPHKRKWVIVFPEGGFLYKQKESSQKYAKKNGFPVLEHTTLPRVGAMKTILDTVGEPYGPVESDSQRDGNDSVNSGKGNNVDSMINHQIEDPSRPLKWVVDVTLAYKNGQPLDMLGMCMGYNPRNEVLLHYRAYRARDIPRDNDGLTKWMYDLYVEKDKVLDHYYKEGKLPEEFLSENGLLPHMEPSYLKFDVLKQILVHMFCIVSCYAHYVYIVKPLIAAFSFASSFIF